MKKIVIFGVLFLIVFLTGCFSTQSVTPEELAALLEDIPIDFTILSAYDNSDGTVKMEIVNGRDADHIWIYLMRPEPAESIRFLVTDEWVYSTLDMSKTANPYAIDTLAGMTALLEDYTTLIDLADFSPASLVAKMTPLTALDFSQSYELERKATVNRLTGLLETEEPVAEGYERRVTLSWCENTILMFQMTVREIESASGMPRNTLMTQQYLFDDQLVWNIADGFPDFSEFMEKQ
jgi:hypothetical protein